MHGKMRGWREEERAMKGGKNGDVAAVCSGKIHREKANLTFIRHCMNVRFMYDWI